MVSKYGSIPVAEQFSSIQGEGRYMGHPSIFLRTAGCNFLCGGDRAAAAYEGTEHEDQTQAMADTMADGGAAWVCDTISEWMDGTERDIAELYDQWAANGFLEKLEQGSHLVLTGGEPLLHQDDLTDFLGYLGREGYEPFVEVETNGSIYPDEAFRTHVDQYNLSPKLSNAGLKRAVRYDPDVIGKFVTEFIQVSETAANADFKFVVGTRDDWAEIESDFLEPFDIPAQNTFVMPAGGDQSELELTRQDVAELAIDHSVQFSERLQIVIWDEATGV
jgi:organic radical activating enzyme